MKYELITLEHCHAVLYKQHDTALDLTEIQEFFGDKRILLNHTTRPNVFYKGVSLSFLLGENIEPNGVRHYIDIGDESISGGKEVYIFVPYPPEYNGVSLETLLGEYLAKQLSK